MKELQKALNNLTEISHNLSNRLENVEDWNDEDDKRLDKLNKIVALLVKLYPYSKDEDIEMIDPEEDQKIIDRFLERKLPECKKE